MILLIFNKF